MKTGGNEMQEGRIERHDGGSCNNTCKRNSTIV